MTKIVINADHGGFGLSHEAMLEYARLKKITLYPEPLMLNGTNVFNLQTYWTVPKDQRIEWSKEQWPPARLEERQAYNAKEKSQRLYDRDLSRTDPILVQVVETLGDRANGPSAKLEVVELAPGTRYRIQEYVGVEWIETEADIEWSIA